MTIPGVGMTLTLALRIFENNYQYGEGSVVIEHKSSLPESQLI